MTDQLQTNTISDLLAVFAQDFGLNTYGEWDKHRAVTGLVIWGDHYEDLPSESLLLVRPTSPQHLVEIIAAISDTKPTILLSWNEDVSHHREILRGFAVIIAPASLSFADFVRSYERWSDPLEASTARKLAAIQAKYNLALTQADPLQDLFKRVSRQLGGTVALIDDSKRIHASSGPLPTSHVFPALEGSSAPTVRIVTEHWNGAAIRVSVPTLPGQKTGWLIGLVAAPHRFESLQFAGLHLAAPMFETIMLLRDASQAQEQAVTAAVLNEALAFKPQRHNGELQGKILGSGIVFSEALHVVVIQPKSTNAVTARRQFEAFANEARQTLDGAAMKCLVTAQEQQLVVLAQMGVTDLRRLLASNRNKLSDARIGVGRNIDSVADIATSYQDAILALRIEKIQRSSTSYVAAEDFDYAFRLFSEIGLDTMVAWARNLFEPLWERETLLVGLQAYFACNQNMNIAAEALGIHHNSLRYRIAKAEEALDLSLRSPSSIASVFLGLTALEVGQQLRPFSPQKAQGAQLATGETVVPGAASVPQEILPRPSGAVFGDEN